MIKGVLFDMDGVLVDSESFICRAAIMMFKEIGLDVLPDDFIPFVGTGENSYLGGVAGKYGKPIEMEKAKARTYEIFGDLARGQLKALPGALELIKDCLGKGLRISLATSADRVKMEISLNEIDLPPSTFNTIITGLDVARKKPYPDIYIKAAESLGLEPSGCLVVEDSVSGITAGKAAGCKCLAVTTSFSPAELTEADWICSSLLQVPDDALNW
ncbi:MAG TPA: HAD-IA family hydrolase [Bacteroidales bacterium]|jgi:HAD superfamily hydrolase (TIGR01509 family)|nr:HAD-IA family hydrolase [Bacteroidales bacterium]HNR42309.1 HAD-IA family hydrolase [Bacteroidales bacterium]HPM19144.1 HAD-IA family hydrolase [Bacteroidales bacterium]HQG76669.1 HAD-IA family hydrolase [Bacteroidales bacterium]